MFFSVWISNEELNCLSKDSVRLYLGVGKKHGKRSIKSDFSQPILGYTEKWSQKYLKIEIRPEYSSGKYYVYGDLYIMYTFDVKNRVFASDVTVKLKGKLNYGIEIGGGIKDAIKKSVDFFASVFYERQKFGKSDPEFSSVIQGYVNQPESKRETYGLKIGIKFQ